MGEFEDMLESELNKLEQMQAEFDAKMNESTTNVYSKNFVYTNKFCYNDVVTVVNHPFFSKYFEVNKKTAKIVNLGIIATEQNEVKTYQYALELDDMSVIEGIEEKYIQPARFKPTVIKGVSTDEKDKE